MQGRKPRAGKEAGDRGQAAAGRGAEREVDVFAEQDEMFNVGDLDGMMDHGLMGGECKLI